MDYFIDALLLLLIFPSLYIALRTTNRRALCYPALFINELADLKD